MNLKKFVFSLTTVALGVASAASSYTVKFADPVSIGTTQLKAGEYTVEMQGSVAVFKSEKKKVAEVPATLAAGAQKYKYTVFQSKDSKVNEIDLGGTSSKIVFAPEIQTAAK